MGSALKNLFKKENSTEDEIKQNNENPKKKNKSIFNKIE